MTIHVCGTCSKEFPRKENLERHLQRKKPCTLDDEINKEFPCDRCNKHFRFESNLSRHRQSCAGGTPTVDDLQQQIAELHETVQKLSLQPQSITHNVGDSNVHIGNNITLNVNVNNLGQESQDHLTSLTYKELKKLMKLTPDHETLMAMIQFIHLHEEHPENRNVRLSDGDETAEVRRKGKWVKESSDNAIYDIISRNCLRFIDVSDVLEKGMQKAKHDALTEYLECAEDMANKENADLHAGRFAFRQLLSKARAAFSSEI